VPVSAPTARHGAFAADWKGFARIALAGAVMAGALIAIRAKGLVAMVAVGAVVFAAGALLLKAITRKDLRQMAGSAEYPG